MRNTYHIGFEAGLIFPVQQFPPVDTVEELMGLDLRRAIHAQTFRGIAVEQFGEEITSSGRYDLGSREVKWFRQDLAIHVVSVLIVERRETCQHFVKQDSERPPIDCLGVAGTVKEFGCEIFGSTTECYGRSVRI